MFKAASKNQAAAIIPEGLANAICVSHDQHERKTKSGGKILKLTLRFATQVNGDYLYLEKEYDETLDIGEAALTDLSLWQKKDSIEFSKSNFDPAVLFGQQVQLVVINRMTKGGQKEPTIVTLLPSNGDPVPIPKEYNKQPVSPEPESEALEMEKAA
jgi:hypothetical protein